jgi:hypothetical protein
MSNEVLEKVFKIHGQDMHNSSIRLCLELLVIYQSPGRGVGKLAVCSPHGGGLLVHSPVGKPFLAVRRLRITGLVHILLLGPAPDILILFVGPST